MKNLMILSLVLLAGTVCAQDYTFKVLVNKGQNSVRAGNQWLPIKVGASLDATDELRVSPSGYLGLVHVSGKPMEVKEAGTYKVSDLASQIKTSTSVLNKYTDFILSATTEGQMNLTATGAVTRGEEEIEVYLPEAKKAVVLNDEVMISWAPQEKKPVYVVQFSSMFGDELDRQEVRDTVLTVNLASPKFANEDNIVVKVFLKNDPKIDSEEFFIKRLSAGDKNRLREELEQIKSLVSENTALNHFYLGNFYEQNTLLIDAATAYQKAIRMAPQVEDFKSAFSHFVARHKLKN